MSDCVQYFHFLVVCEEAVELSSVAFIACLSCWIWICSTLRVVPPCSFKFHQRFGHQYLGFSSGGWWGVVGGLFGNHSGTSISLSLLWQQMDEWSIHSLLVVFHSMHVNLLWILHKD
jgi:hypothetical protein